MNYLFNCFISDIFSPLQMIPCDHFLGFYYMLNVFNNQFECGFTLLKVTPPQRAFYFVCV